MTMTAHEAFEAGTAAFNAHDFDAFADLLTDDVVFELPGAPRMSGRDACVEAYRAWIGAFPDAHVEVDAAHHVDDQLIVEEGRFVGTHDGVLHTPNGDIPPTGRSVEVAYVHILRFRDGRHAYFGLTFDRLLMLEQLGLAPVPANAA